MVDCGTDVIAVGVDPTPIITIEEQADTVVVVETTFETVNDVGETTVVTSVEPPPADVTILAEQIQVISISGAQGPVGPTGATGATGDQGDKGDKGDTGPMGPAGYQELFDDPSPLSGPVQMPYLRFERDVDGDVQRIWIGTDD